MPKCDFNIVALQLYWNHTLAWVFSCTFAAYFQNTFLQEQLWRTASAHLIFFFRFCCSVMFVLFSKDIFSNVLKISGIAGAPIFHLWNTLCESRIKIIPSGAIKTLLFCLCAWSLNIIRNGHLVFWTIKYPDWNYS